MEYLLKKTDQTIHRLKEKDECSVLAVRLVIVAHTAMEALTGARLWAIRRGIGYEYNEYICEHTEQCQSRRIKGSLL